MKSRVIEWSIRFPRVVFAAMAVLAVLALQGAQAADEAQEGLNWLSMGMELLGGLALFLFGMEQMADGLKAVAGERMKLILARLTTNRFMGALTGAFVTAVIQSSSVTTVLVVGFISAGLLSMAQSIGVIMGANIGTTVTAQIVAFKVTKAALAMIAVGFAMLFISRNERIRQYGGIIMGLGLVFFGMHVMSEAMHPLRSYQPFLDLMTRMENPLFGILVAAGFTALIQSSSATTAIVIVLASQGFVTLPAGIALAFGANIGTCVTAMLAAIGKPREAVRAALVHVLFNVFGVLIWVGFIPQLAAAVTLISPSHPGLDGAARLAAETPRQIANAHTVFNVSNTFIFIWFTAQFARLVEWMMPDRPLEEAEAIRARFLDEALLETPSLALDRVRLEIGHMGEQVKSMLKGLMAAVLRGDNADLKRIAEMDNAVDTLHGHIVSYLGRISQQSPLTEQQTETFLRLMQAANDLENIGDIMEVDLVTLGQERIEQEVTVSEATEEVLMGLHRAVTRAVDTALRSIAENDEAAALEVIGMKGEINELVDAAIRHQADRLVADEPKRLVTYKVEVDIIEKLKRIYYFAKRIAKEGLPPGMAEGVTKRVAEQVG
jgi:phosphate:Na+ symporter